MAYDYKAKRKNIIQLNNYMLAKTLSMFEYTGLPETIPAKELEKILQQNGFAFIYEHSGKLYAFKATRSGEQDAYGNTQDVTVNNVYLNLNKTLNIESDGVLFSNDDMEIGLLPLLDKCNSQLVENDINMTLWGFNSRTQKLISAPDDKTKENADQYLKKIIDGDISCIGENAFFDGVKVQATNNSSSYGIQSMVEYQQYIKSTLYNEIGISSNFNMKRERLVSGEVEQNEDSLFPYVYNMLQNRMVAVQRINEKYGLNITVDFGSVWKIKQIELEKELTNEQTTDKGTAENGSGNNIETPVTQEVIDDNGNGKQGQAPETSPETSVDSDAENKAELEAIINSDESSDDEKQAARDLLAELEVKENV